MAPRSTTARIVRFIPDCVVLLSRLGRDRRVSRRHRWMLVATAAYLASPVDLIPDFLPVVGQLDDAALVVIALRRLVNSAGVDLVAEHWPGDPRDLQLVLRATGVRDHT